MASRVTVRAAGLVADGAAGDVDAHAAVKAGSVTVLAALGSQARVLTKVPVIAPDGSAASAKSPAAAGAAAVHFDKLDLAAQPMHLSVTAGALGSAVVPLPATLALDAPVVVDAKLAAAGSAAAKVHFSVRLELTRTPAGVAPAAAARQLAAVAAATPSGPPASVPVAVAPAPVAPAPATAATMPAAASTAAPATVVEAATVASGSGGVAREARRRPAAPAVVIEPAPVETVVLKAPSAPPAVKPAPVAVAAAPAALAAPVPPAASQQGLPPTAVLASSSAHPAASSVAGGGGPTAAAAGVKPRSASGASGGVPASAVPDKPAAAAAPPQAGNAKAAPAAPPQAGKAKAAPAVDLQARLRQAVEAIDAQAAASPHPGGTESPEQQLPTRLIDYFCVMVSEELQNDDQPAPSQQPEGAAHRASYLLGGEDEAAAEGDTAGLDSDTDEAGCRVTPLDSRAPPYRRRIGRIQYRYPKVDHPDVPLPESSDWFIFPNGIAPIVQQPTLALGRPPTRRSAFVLSNVAGATLGGRMYGCCLTAYRREDVQSDEDDENDDGSASGGREVLWWPVVLFMLSRYPLVPQLAELLEAVYAVYDAGTSTGELPEGSVPPPAFCTLHEYLRQLVFEAPLPLRRMYSPGGALPDGAVSGGGLAVRLYLPGPEPSTAATVTLQLPPPDALPALQFDPRVTLLAQLPPRVLLAGLAALWTERRVVVVARSVQGAVEVCESLLSLLYPLGWDFPYIPVLPAHLAVDCLSNPVPFLYGLTTSYAGRALGEVPEGDREELVVLDVTAGVIDMGTSAFLARRRLQRQRRLQGGAAHSRAAPAPAPLPVELRLPEPLASEAEAELTAIVATASAAAPSTTSAAAVSSALQSLCIRLVAALLHGYRACAFFPGAPLASSGAAAVSKPAVGGALLSPLGAPAFSTDIFVAAKAGGATDAVAAANSVFYRALVSTQMFHSLLAKHGSLPASIALRPYHRLCAAAAELGATPLSIAALGRAWQPALRAVCSHPAAVLVVPPPGFTLSQPQYLPLWQPLQPGSGGAASHLVLLPAAGVTSLGGSAVVDPKADKRAKKAAKRDKREEAELARRWGVGAVAHALVLSPSAQAQLSVLIASSGRGHNGSAGDDVGAASEACEETALMMTSSGSRGSPAVSLVPAAGGLQAGLAAALGRIRQAAASELAAAAADFTQAPTGGAVSSSSLRRGLLESLGLVSPAIATASSANGGPDSVARANSTRRRFGFLGRSKVGGGKTSASSSTPDDGGDDAAGCSSSGSSSSSPAAGAGASSNGSPVDRVVAWLQGVLCSPAHSGGASGDKGAAPLTAINGVPWTAEDDAVMLSLAAPSVRAAFAVVLQAQLLLAAGVAPPLVGAGSLDQEGAATLLVQLQPGLGGGVCPHLVAAPPVTGSLIVQPAAAASSAGGGAAGIPSAATAAIPPALPFRGLSAADARALTALTRATLPLPRFQRLAGMCAALLHECATAAAALPAGSVTVLAALAPAVAVLQASLHVQCSGTRSVLSELAQLRPLVASASLWQAYAAAALAAEEQQAALLLLPGASVPPTTSAASPTAAPLLLPSTVELVTGGVPGLLTGGAPTGLRSYPALLLASMSPLALACGLPPDDVGALFEAVCGPDVPESDKDGLIALLEGLVHEVEEAASVGRGLARPSADYAPWGMPAVAGGGAASVVAPSPAAAAAAAAAGLKAAPSSAAGTPAVGAASKTAAAAGAAAHPPTSPAAAAPAPAAGKPPVAPPAAAKDKAPAAVVATGAAPPPAPLLAHASVTGGTPVKPGASKTEPAPSSQLTLPPTPSMPAATPAAAAAAAAPPTEEAGGASVPPPGGLPSSPSSSAPPSPDGLVVTTAAVFSGGAHPWAHLALPRAEVEARAAELVAVRRDPPAPDAALLTVLANVRKGTAAAAAAAASKGGAGKKTDEQPPAATVGAATSTAALAALQPMPTAGGLIQSGGGGSGAPLAGSGLAAAGPGAGATWAPGDPLSASPAAATTSRGGARSSKRGKVAIVRKFGTTGGLSVTSSNFSAAMSPEAMAALLEHARSQAELGAATTAALTPAGPAASSAGVPPIASGTLASTPAGDAGSGTGGGSGGGGSTTWTTVDVGDMGLLDAVLHTLVTSHAAVAEQAAAKLRGGADGGSGGGSGAPEVGAVTAVQMCAVAFRGHTPGAAITCMSHDPRDGRAVTGGNDGRVACWDMRDRVWRHTYDDHGAAVTSVRLCGDVVVSASQDGLVRVSAFSRGPLATALAEADAAQAQARADKLAARNAAKLQAAARRARPSAAAASSSGGSSSSSGGGDGTGASSVGGGGGAPARPPRFPDDSEAKDDDDAVDGVDREPDADASHDHHPQRPSASSSPSSTGNFSLSFTADLLARTTGTLGRTLAGGLGGGGGGGSASGRFDGLLKLKGHSGPVTCVDAWERPPEVQRDWLGRAKTGGDPHAPTLPWASSYIVASGGTDGTVRTWGVKWRVGESGRVGGEAVPIAAHTALHRGAGATVECVRLAPDGRLLVSAGRDGRVGVVDVPTGKSWTMALPPSSSAGGGGGGFFGRGRGGEEPWPADPAVPTGLPLVTCAVDVFRRPVTITTAGVDGCARVWDLRAGGVCVAFPSGSPVWCFGHVPGHGAGAAQLSAEGELLAGPAPIGDQFLLTGHEDGLVRKWDSRRPGVPLAVLAGHRGAVTSLATDGSDKAVTGSTDGSVRLWDASSGLSVSCEGHGGPVSAVAMADDYMLSASWDGSVRAFFPAT